MSTGQKNLAIVTGASSGIGRATARYFVDAGWKTHTISRSPSNVAGVGYSPCDLADLEQVQRLGQSLIEEIQSADKVCLVHNAGVMHNDAANDFSLVHWQETMTLNVTTPGLLSGLWLPHMGKGSSVIYVGSTLSEQAVPGRLSYVTSKHAVVGLMRSTMQDLFGKHIHTCCVCPGFTDTSMLRPLLDQNPGLADAVRQMVSFGRLIDPDEIAQVILFAANHPVINGSILHANLGQRQS